MGEKFDDVKGRAKEAAGDLTGDKDLKREGKIDQAKADAKEKVGKAADKVSEITDKVTDRIKDVTK
jgi:uncharacterized protein YjbJ (UPF0337 family)